MLIVHLLVSYAHVNLYQFFSSSVCRGLAVTSACGSSWTFLFTFLSLPCAGLTIFYNLTVQEFCQEKEDWYSKFQAEFEPTRISNNFRVRMTMT